MHKKINDGYWIVIIPKERVLQISKVAIHLCSTFSRYAGATAERGTELVTLLHLPGLKYPCNIHAELSGVIR